MSAFWAPSVNTPFAFAFSMANFSNLCALRRRTVASLARRTSTSSRRFCVIASPPPMISVGQFAHTDQLLKYFFKNAIALGHESSTAAGLPAISWKYKKEWVAFG